MNFFRVSRIASPLSISIAIATFLLLTFPAILRADDNQKKKKDSSAQSKSTSKSSSSTSSGGSAVSGSAGVKHHTDNSGGTSTTTGRTHSGSGGTSANGDGSRRRTGRDTSSTSTSSGAGTATGDSGSQKTGKTGKIRSTDGSAARTNGSLGTDTSTANGKGNKHDRSSSGSTSSDTGSNSLKGNKHNKSTATDGATSTNTLTDVKGKKHDRSNATGEAVGTTTNGKSGKAASTNTRSGFTRSSNGKPEIYRGRDGSEARFRHDGTIREVHTRNMTIIHRPGGSRTVIVDRPDRSRIVVNRFGHGYVQRPFLYRGHEFAHRTYFYRGQPYALYYRGYAYRGVSLHGYVPYRYYSPAFYGWAYRPWYRPVRYSWGWFGSPWYGNYGRYYFTPYSAYPSASFWLTDYLISASLQAAYEERLANQSYYSSGSSDAVMLSPEVKDEISNEVQRQLALENSESRIAVSGDLDMNSSGLPRMLAEASPTNPRIFVVSGSLDVADNQGQECTLTEGDVLRLSTPPPSNASTAYLQVLATKNQGCQKGSMVSVGFADLQEMQNHMRATIDRGLGELQSHQGGLPAPPANAAVPPVQASFAPIAPPPDANVSNELRQQARDADAADREVLNEVNQAGDSVAASGSSSTQPDEISLGQTTREVEAILGKPKQVVNLGAKRLYVYPNMKITFIDGKVSDVE